MATSRVSVKSRLLPQVSRKDWLRPSVLALIAANLVPLFGVFAFGWEVFPLLLLFWCENVIIGFFNAVKMLSAAPHDIAKLPAKLFLVAFFCIHYGVFTFVHGIFVVTLFGGGMHGMNFPSVGMFANQVREHQLTWAALGLFVSHAISFGHNFIMAGEFQRARTDTLMAQPYGRILVLHFTIIAGGGLMMALRSPAVGLALLVVLKILLDLRGHLKEREKFGNQRPKSGGVAAQP